MLLLVLLQQTAHIKADYIFAPPHFMVYDFDVEASAYIGVSATSGVHIFGTSHIIDGLLHIEGHQNSPFAVHEGFITIPLQPGIYRYTLTGQNINDISDRVFEVLEATWVELNFVSVSTTVGRVFVYVVDVDNAEVAITNVDGEAMIREDSGYFWLSVGGVYALSVYNEGFYPWREEFTFGQDYSDSEPILVEMQPVLSALLPTNFPSVQDMLIGLISVVLFLLLVIAIWFVVKISKEKLANKSGSKLMQTDILIHANRLQTLIVKKRGLRKEWLLPPITFDILPKDMIYIVGESGSGKTVLLKILGGYDMKTSGQLTFFSKLSWKHDNQNLKQYVGYVPQIDALYNELTPYKLLKYYSKVLPDASNTDVMKHVTRLNLTNVKDENIGKLSGGERKRVSIAIELLRKPAILLLDEPDSGLDPESRQNLYNMLHEINESGTTIILSTHYTDVVDADEVDEIPIFNKTNEGLKGTVSMYVRRRHGQPNDVVIKNKASQQSSLISTSLRLFFREARLYLVSNIVLAAISVLCSFLLWLATTAETFNTYGDALAIAFAIACAAILIGLMMSINMVCKNYNMLRRELRMGVPVRCIIFSKILHIVALCSVMSLILVIPYILNCYFDFYDIYDQNTLFLYLSIFFTMFAASGLGLLASAAFYRWPQNATLSISLVMLFQILFSGFVFDQVRVSLDRIALSNYAIRSIGGALRFDIGVRHNNDFIVESGARFLSTAEHAFQTLGSLTIFLTAFLILSAIIIYLLDSKGVNK